MALSGLTVAIGFLALLLVPLNELRSAVLGGLLVALVSVLVAATLLPVALAALGAARARPLARAAGRRRGPLARLEPVGRAPARWTVLLVAGLPLLLLAAQAVRLDPRIPRGDWLPPSIESARGIADLRAMGRGGRRASRCAS